MYTVYVLRDPRTNEVRYIGCTMDIERRMIEHRRNKDGNANKRAWIAELQAQGMQPALAILVDGLKEQEAFDQEQRWIIKYRDEGASLLNYQYNNSHRPYKKRRRLITTHVVFSRKEYEHHKALGHNVEYSWEFHARRQQSAS